MFNSSLEIIIKAKDEASQVVSGINDKLKGMESAFKKMAVAGTVAFGAIAAVAVTSFKAFADAQAQTEITNKSLQNTLAQMNNGALAELQKQLGGTKDALTGITQAAADAGAAAIKLGFDDETAANSYAKLFAATKNAKQAQEELTIAEDLARYKNISLEEATQKLMMVHAGATKELKALGLAVVDGNSAMQNMDAIQKQVSGSAEAFGNTAAGAMEKIKVQTDNLKESIGAALAPAFQKIVEVITPLLTKFTEWAEKNPKLLADIILVAGAVAGLVAVVGTLGVILPAIITGFTLLAGPIGLVIAAIAALIAITVLIVKNWDSIKTYFVGVWTSIKQTFQAAIDAIVHFFDPLVNIIEKVQNVISRVGSGIASVAKSVGGKIAGLFGGGKAVGGSVSGSTTYLVGENGPELFTPGVGGSITPNDKLGGGSSFVVNINGGILS